MAWTDTPMPCGLNVPRCSTSQGIFVHPDFVAAAVDDSEMIESFLQAVTMAKALALLNEPSFHTSNHNQE